MGREKSEEEVGRMKEEGGRRKEKERIAEEGREKEER